MAIVSTLLVLLLSQTTAVLAEDSELFIKPASAEKKPLIIMVSPEAAHAIAKRSDQEILAEEEAIERARANSIELKPWGHPWVVVKAAIGVPGNINALLEFYVHDNWSVELGAGTGLIANVIYGNLRWHPEATSWTWNHYGKAAKGKRYQKSQDKLGFSWVLDVGFVPNAEGSGGNSEGYFAVGPDFSYTHRYSKHFGIQTGLKATLGPSFRVGPDSEIGNDPVLELFLYSGLVF